MKQTNQIIEDLRLCAKTGDAAPSWLCDEAAKRLTVLDEMVARATEGRDIAAPYERSIFRYILGELPQSEAALAAEPKEGGE